jgi:hypothetical protein
MVSGEAKCELDKDDAEDQDRKDRGASETSYNFLQDSDHELFP